MNTALNLLDQIIEMAQAQATELDQLNLERHKASKTIGTNSIVFHLHQLRELLTTKPLPSTIELGNKTMTVAYGQNGISMGVGTDDGL